MFKAFVCLCLLVVVLGSEITITTPGVYFGDDVKLPLLGTVSLLLNVDGDRASMVIHKASSIYDLETAAFRNIVATISDDYHSVQFGYSYLAYQVNCDQTKGSNLCSLGVNIPVKSCRLDGVDVICEGNGLEPFRLRGIAPEAESVY